MIRALRCTYCNAITYTVQATLLLILFLSLSVQGEAASHVFISEINFAGSLADNNCKTVPAANRCGMDKWLEITNNSGAAQSLDGYRLIFRNSTDSPDIFTFPDEITIQPQGKIVVGYTEVNFDSVLHQSGYPAIIHTSKILRMSNNQAMTVQVQLTNSEGEIVDAINWGSDTVSTFTAQFNPQNKRSISKESGQWAVSQSAFFGGNFGSPGFIAPAALTQPNPALPVVDYTPNPVTVPQAIAPPTRTITAQPVTTAQPTIQTTAIQPVQIKSVALQPHTFSVYTSTISAHHVPLPSQISAILGQTVHAGFIAHQSITHTAVLFSVCAICGYTLTAEYILTKKQEVNTPQNFFNTMLMPTSLKTK